MEIRMSNMSNAKVNERLFRMRNHLNVIPEINAVAAQGQVLTGRDFEIPTPWGFLRGKEWGRPNREFGIVGLHGMLDNCGTFDRLAPLFPPHYHFVAYDFPGYGLSTPYPPGGYQTKESYLVDFNRVVQHFGWKRLVLIGHSLGGAVSMCIGAANSNIDKVILLDPAKPLSSVGQRAPDYLANFASVIQQVEENQVQQRARTPEEAVQATVAKSRNSLTENSARIMVKRGTRVVDPVKNLVVFNTDSKNLLGVQPMFEEIGTLAFAKYQGTNCDTLLITTPDWAIPDWAIGLDAVSRDDYFTECAKYGRFSHFQVQGTHHVHINHPERVINFILEFVENSRIDVKKPRTQPFKIISY